MAIKDIARKPYIEDNDENIFIGKNTMNVTIVFNITKDPNTLESVSIEIGE